MATEPAHANPAHANAAKDNFRDNSSRHVSVESLLELFPNNTIIGLPQESGVAVIEQSPHGSFVSAAIKHPKYIFDGEKFGGAQTEKMIEQSFVRPVGIEQAAREAQSLLSNCAFPTIGAELEGYVHDAKTGKLVPAQKQIETTRSLREDGTDVCTSPEEMAVTRARMILERAELEGVRGNVVIESGSPLTLGGDHPGASEGLIPGDNPYIQAMCRIFEESYFIPSAFLDSRVQQVLDAYAKQFQFGSIDAMLLELGVGRVWDIAASHVSLGIPGPTPSMEIGIAIANIFSSDLATVAEFLTQGSPLHTGQTVQVNEDNQSHTIKDVRTFSRYFLRTAYVTNPFIRGTEELQERIVKGVVDGVATTPDRAAFHNVGPDGVPFVSAHARARLREFGDLAQPMARVEFVGGSSTPSLHDVIARDVYLTVLWTAALEAVSQGVSPQEHLSRLGFSSAARWENQQELAMSYSMKGVSDKGVSDNIQENILFLSYMKERYPHLKKNIDYVVKRIENMSKKAVATTIDEYTENPCGPISDVLIHMKQNGFDDVEILNQLNRHQLAIAHKVIESNGDFSVL